MALKAGDGGLGRDRIVGVMRRVAFIRRQFWQQELGYAGELGEH